MPVKLEPFPTNDVAFTVPETSRAVEGVVVPMPTLPPLGLSNRGYLSDKSPAFPT